jgi:hypothetical protein
MPSILQFPILDEKEQYSNPCQNSFAHPTTFFFPQLYGWAILRAPQNISRRYFLLHNWPSYFVHKKSKQMHVYMTDKNV